MSFDWNKIKTEYVAVQLQEEVDDVVQYFINQYGMKQSTFVQKRSEFGWDKEVKRQRKILSKQTVDKVRNKLATTKSNDILDEMEMRERVVKRSQKILTPVLKELAKKLKNAGDIKALKIPALVAIVDTVTKVQMKAAGLPEKLDVNSKNLNLNLDADSSYLSPAENRKQLRESEELAINLQSLINEFEAIDVEPSKTKQSKVHKVSKGKGNNKA